MVEPFARFVVYGLPRPQGSKTPYFNKRTGAMGVKESSALTHAQWRNAVTAAAIAVRNGPAVGGPVRFECVYRFPMTKEHRTRYGPHVELLKITQPDTDKLDRSIFDALTASCLITDDAVIARSVSQKLETCGPIGAWVTLTALPILITEGVLV